MADARKATQKLAARIKEQHGNRISGRDAERKAIKVAQKSDNKRSR